MSKRERRHAKVTRMLFTSRRPQELRELRFLTAAFSASVAQCFLFLIILEIKTSSFEAEHTRTRFHRQYVAYMGLSRISMVCKLRSVSARRRVAMCRFLLSNSPQNTVKYSALLNL